MIGNAMGELRNLVPEPTAYVSEGNFFEKDWQREWVAVDVRCQFDHKADTGQGAAFDHMAYVHRSLETTRLKYREMMARFSRDLAGDLAEMRRALDKSQQGLEKRSGARSPAP